MNDYLIIELLCSSTKENIELAQELCKSQRWDILDIIRKYGYKRLGLANPEDFMGTEINCSNRYLKTVPELIPASITEFICSSNRLTKLPAHLPAGLTHLDCHQNWIECLPKHLPDGLLTLNCSINELKTLPNHLPNGLIELNCSFNQLTALPARLPDSLETIYYTGRDNKIANISILETNFKIDQYRDCAKRIR